MNKRLLDQLNNPTPAGKPEGEGPSGGDGGKKGIIGTVIAVLIFVIIKSKGAIFVVLSKFKLLAGALKLGPMLKTFVTMWASIWVYSSYYGWHLAIGVVVLILIHELGHGLAAKVMGLKVGAPVFIPFFGAMIMVKEQFRSTWIESVIGAGGPIAGLLGGLAVYAWGATHTGYFADLCIVTAWFTFMINFFNLLPVFGLDGDRISRPCTFLQMMLLTLISAASIAIATVWSENPMFFIYLIFLCLAAKTWKARKGRSKSALEQIREANEFHAEEAVSPGHRWAATAMYAGLNIALVLAWVSAEAQRARIDLPGL